MKLVRITFLFVLTLAVTCQIALAGNKKIMTIRAAKIIAERGVVESIYGLKIRSSESVENMIAAGFEGKTEVKTEAEIRGIKISDVVYDAEKDIAQATGTIRLDKMTNIDGQELDFKGKIFSRVGFATSTPAMAKPLKALRAAELDAYKQLAKRIVGFTLESQTTVENYILTSDIVKSKVLATIYLARVTDYGWDNMGDAYVKMTVDTSEVSDILGQKIMDVDPVIEVEGQGAQGDDYIKAKTGR
ncbi:MAG: hypothetical protein HGA96_13525 [Desulfobulbaceae bacterium]|nr:hypothetical protein [Desulfobulbaceae bacterium]